MNSWIDFIETQRKSNPDKLAFFGEESCSYQEFYELCLKAQNKIASFHLKKNSRVIVISERNLYYFVVFAGCILNELVFVPLEETTKSNENLLMIYHGSYLIDDIAKFAFDLNSFDTPLINAIKAENLGQVLFTSGSTGEPKEIISPNRFFLNLSGNFDGFNKDIKLVCMLPLNHYGGFHATLSALKVGGSVNFVKGVMDLDNLFNAFEKYYANAIFATPTIMRMLLKICKEEMKQLPLQTLYLVGEPCSKSLKDELYAVFSKVKIYNLYGSSECGLVSYDLDEEDGCLGKVVAGKEVIIKDNVIYVKTDYGADKCDFYQDDSKVYSMNDNGYLKDEKLYFLGREGKIINSGGLKINPYEIENTLKNNSQIDDCIVIGVKDKLLGQKCVLYYAGAMTVTEVKQFLIKKLDEYKIPHEIVLVDNFKQNANGKIDRRYYEKGEN